MAKDFPDHFSKQSATYRRYRPGYPDSLFNYLSNLVPKHNLVWDCGTGNGQSASGLAAYFSTVIATDPSEEQIKNAIQKSNIIYRTEKAEEPSLENNSADLITVSQALHWFDLEKFYAEVKRVLKPSGVFAAWTYALPKLTSAVDELVNQFHNITVDEFWQEPNRMVEKEYATLWFPFEKISSPDFMRYSEFSREDLPGLLRSWSGTQRFIEAKGYDPVVEFEEQLLKVWSEEETIPASWKITLKAGMVSS